MDSPASECKLGEMLLGIWAGLGQHPNDILLNNTISTKQLPNQLQKAYHLHILN